MNENSRYTLTRAACYISYFVQASVITLIPLLFVPIKNDLGLSYLRLASLLSINFITQLITDLLLSRAADKHGYKPFVLIADALAFCGLLLFAASPSIFSEPYFGFIIATVLYSIGGGLMEIVISPLINSLPSPSKSGSMAFLHATYGIGQMLCILITTVFIRLTGEEHWQIIIACFALLPLINFIMYLNAKFTHTDSAHAKASHIGKIVKNPLFFVCLLIIFFGAGVENNMVQWSSAYMEKAMSLPKLLGDSLGIFMFALMLTLCRILFGVAGNRLCLEKAMLGFSICAIFTYIAVAFTEQPSVGLIACALTGFFSAMLWPGTLVLADRSFPSAGAWIFAILAFAGDCGAAFCPWITGLISDNADKIRFLTSLFGNDMTNEQLGLRAGMAFSVVYPVLTALAIALYIVWFKNSKAK